MATRHVYKKRKLKNKAKTAICGRQRRGTVIITVFWRNCIYPPSTFCAVLFANIRYRLRLCQRISSSHRMQVSSGQM